MTYTSDALPETSDGSYSEADASLPITDSVPEAAPTEQPQSGSAMYVQAGAFADVGRADLARRRLSLIGPIVMSPSRVNGRDLLRVRVGPLYSDGEREFSHRSVERASPIAGSSRNEHTSGLSAAYETAQGTACTLPR